MTLNMADITSAVKSSTEAAAATAEAAPAKAPKAAKVAKDPNAVPAKRGRKPSTEKKTKIVANPDGLTFVTAHDFVTQNQGISNGKIITAAEPEIKKFEGQHVLIALKDDIQLYHDMNRLQVVDFKPESVKILPSGIVAEDKENRVYITKTNTIHMKMVDSIPNKMYTIKKDCSYHIDNPERSADIDALKLTIQKVSQKLYATIKDMTKKEDIKAAIIKFISNVTDVNHLIKIDEEILLKFAM